VISQHDGGGSDIETISNERTAKAWTGPQKKKRRDVPPQGGGVRGNNLEQEQFEKGSSPRART